MLKAFGDDGTCHADRFRLAGVVFGEKQVGISVDACASVPPRSDGHKILGEFNVVLVAVDVVIQGLTGPALFRFPLDPFTAVDLCPAWDAPAAS